MKPKSLLLTFLVVLLNTAAFATKPDNEAVPAYQLQLLPNLDVLYFNQSIDFALPSLTTDVIDHVEFNRGTVQITPTGFTLNIDYSNIPEATDELKVFVRNTAGIVKLTYQKNITLKQKLSERNFESVGNDNNIFKLDDEIVTLKNAATTQKLLHSHKLDINTDRFDQDNISLQSFDMLIQTAEGAKIFHSATNQITDEMKAAIKTLADGDSITFLNIITEYSANNQRVKMNLNYFIKYVIGTVG
jgi:hypothetical protein